MDEQVETDPVAHGRRLAVLAGQAAFDPEKYEFSDAFQPAKNLTASTVHTTPELMALLESDSKIEVDARVLAYHPEEGTLGIRRFSTRAKFLEAAKKNQGRKLTSKFREAVDSFGDDSGYASGASRVGDDYVPLLGGPFNKQLYYYDYLRMHALAFHAYHHDPMAKHVVQMTRDFTLGRGFRVDSEDKEALAVWRAFEEVNDLPLLMEQLAIELSIYGESMVWWLPDGATKIGFRLSPAQEPAKGIIPRIRLIDPSVIWEIVTYPEDISRVLYYQWVAPTQFQMYTGRDGGSTVPGSKFIMQQIPGADVQHHKVNSVSNEKRGRSDLFPILGYLKRLRDSVNYSLVSLQKQAAWSIDTTITGSQADINSYADEQEALGTVAPAGSEFVHTDKVKREYLSNAGAKAGGSSTTFEWCMSMIATGTGYPISYFGTHLSGGQTRASAVVGTEPVTKRLEARQIVYERVVQQMWKRLMQKFGKGSATCEVTWPEIITADRTAKLKDLALSEAQGWIASRRAATIAAKELQVSRYDYDAEQGSIAEDKAQGLGSTVAPSPAPLSTPGAASPEAPSALPSDERARIKTNGRS